MDHKLYIQQGEGEGEGGIARQTQGESPNEQEHNRGIQPSQSFSPPYTVALQYMHAPHSTSFSLSLHHIHCRPVILSPLLSHLHVPHSLHWPPSKPSHPFIYHNSSSPISHEERREGKKTKEERGERREERREKRGKRRKKWQKQQLMYYYRYTETASV